MYGFRYRWAVALCAMGIGSSACGGGDDPAVDASAQMDAASGMDAAQVCADDAACSDESFCNGQERCEPGAEGADARGCVAASEARCMPTQTCDEAEDLCLTMCDVEGDADGDGRRAIDCGGDDCDDADPNRFPGNPEVCDVDDHDEDCDPATFGFRDIDGDGAPGAECCNVDEDGTARCGTDCNDASTTTHPTAPEVCDGNDNDCDDATDEGVTETFWPDGDGDGFGSSDPAALSMEACFTPPDHADNNRDCDDASAGVNPGNPEICDAAAVDEDCDGVANPSATCVCTGSSSRPCALPGACASGVETCADGSWGACSISPVAEACNELDDDCDGATDEAVSVTCYDDADNDGYAAAGAPEVERCPDASRIDVGGCPASTTNRPPLGAAIDCNDTVSTTRPGASEICNGGDDDCDGTVDEGVSVVCYQDEDGDAYADSGASAQQACPTPSRPSFGYCPAGLTDRAPSGDDADCDDTASDVHPAATERCADDGIDEDCDGMVNEDCTCTNGDERPCPAPGICAGGTQTCAAGAWGACSVSAVAESCNSSDDDCDGRTDEGVTTTCYADGDEDGYAEAAAATMLTCGGCPTGWTDRTPSGTNIDCRPGDGATYPGATEICDRVDNDCSSGGGAEPLEDEDGDGHAAPGAPCSPTASFPRDDCEDGDARVHPGQSAYFGTPYCTFGGGSPGACPCGCFGDGGACACPIDNPSEESFDYDCSGDEEPQEPKLSCGCAPFCGGQGPTSAGVDCGSFTSYRRCEGGCLGLPGGSCTEDLFVRRMQCH